MCVLLHLLICTALRAHIIVVEALYKKLISQQKVSDNFLGGKSPENGPLAEK